jgi:predicted amidohydrolase
VRISLLQPDIVRGDIAHNGRVIQRLVDEAAGNLLVLPEYALTGSLVLEPGADVMEWAMQSAAATAQIVVPEGKHVLLNALRVIDGELVNCCELLPTGERQCKLFPDETEESAGILPGQEQTLFELSGKRFKVIVCTDLRHMEVIPTDDLDFALWIFHFTERNYEQAMADFRRVAGERGLRMLVSSLVSDVNIGQSAYLDGGVMASLGRREGILEVDLLT